MAEKIKKQWEELSRKYKLPEFSFMNAEFSIGSIDDTDYPLKAVAENIAERIEFYVGVLGDILQPEPSSIYAMHETRFFDEEEKKAVYSVYTKLMAYSRRCLEISIINTEKIYAEFILVFCGEWNSTKQELLGFATKMRQSWVVEADIKEDLGYLG